MLVGKGTVGKYIVPTNEINSFLTDVRRFTTPTVKEEEELVRRIKDENDKSAMQELVARNLRFIYAIAKVYARNESEVLDYVNEGVEGFYQAIETFDISRGYRFITYASFYLRRQMGQYMNVTRNIVRKSNNAKLAKPIEKIRQREFSLTGENPADEKIKEILRTEYGINVKDNSDIFELSITYISDEVDDDYTIEETSEFNSVTASKNDYERTIENEYTENTVNQILSIIPERQRNIIKKLFGIGCDAESIEDVAFEMNCDVADIERMRDKTFKYIKQNVSRKKISL